MKKSVLTMIAMAALLSVGSVQAATDASSTTATAPSKATDTTRSTLTGQQNRMKMCAAQYHAKKIEKSKYRAFMQQCLKNPDKTKTPTAQSQSLESYRATTNK